MALAASGLALGPWFVEAWRLQLLAIDHDPWAKLGPGLAHDPELSCDGLKLWPGGVFNFYCELFHISFIVSAGPALAISDTHRTIGCFDKFNHRKNIKRGKIPLYPSSQGLSTINFFSCTLMGGPTRLKPY